MSELKKESLRVLPLGIQPTSCEVNNTKKHHYFKVPTQPQIATCLCNKYHTSFTSRYYKITYLPSTSQILMDISPNISTKCFNRITEELPTSPILKKQDLPNQPQGMRSAFLRRNKKFNAIGEKNQPDLVVIPYRAERQ